MAKSSDYDAKPRPDIYLALIIFTTLAMLVAVGIMWYESSVLKG